jgi:hypothetical protein
MPFEPPPDRKYRVVQWGTGNIGKVAIRHFVSNPVFDLVGVLVFHKEKAGKDVGELVGIPPIGLAATDDLEVIKALGADCVFYAPLTADIEEACMLLRSGLNVVTPGGVGWYETKHNRADLDKIEAACREGNTSIHGSGIHPGFAGDLLPLTLARIASRIDTIHFYEVVNFGTDTLKYMEEMGMGRNPNEFSKGPNLLGDSAPFFAESMTMVVEGLGKKVEQLTMEVEVGTAIEDIHWAATGTDVADMPETTGVIKKGTVASQYHKWTAWVEGKPLVVFHEMYTMDQYDLIDPPPQGRLAGEYRYQVVVEGDPPMEIVLKGVPDAEGKPTHPGYTWTTMAGVNAIPAVCDAPPGFVTHLDLGLMPLRGLVRS